MATTHRYLATRAEAWALRSALLPLVEHGVTGDQAMALIIASGAALRQDVISDLQDAASESGAHAERDAWTR